MAVGGGGRKDGQESMSDDVTWWKELRKALEVTGDPYFAVVLRDGGRRTVTFATAGLGDLPAVLRGIADDLERGLLMDEVEGGTN